MSTHETESDDPDDKDTDGIDLESGGSLWCGLGSGLGSALEIDGVAVDPADLPGAGMVDLPATGLRTTERADEEEESLQLSPTGYVGSMAGAHPGDALDAQRRAAQVPASGDGELARYATITNLAGHSWYVKVLQRDGVTPMWRPLSREQWLDQHFEQRKRDFLRDHGVSSEIGEKGTENDGNDVPAIPPHILHEANRIGLTPHSLVEIIAEEDVERSAGSAADVGNGGDSGCFVEAGKRYFMAVVVRTRWPEMVADIVGDAGDDLKSSVWNCSPREAKTKLVKHLKKIATVEEFLEFFWQESDFVDRLDCSLASLVREVGQSDPGPIDSEYDRLGNPNRGISEIT
jgi:hypothetical protein